MLVFVITKYLNDYTVFKNNSLFMTARREPKFFGDRVIFFDEKGEKIAGSKQTYFLIMSLGYRLWIKGQKNPVRVYRSGLTKFVVEYEEKKYEFRYKLFRMDSNLYVNGEEVGTIKIIGRNSYSLTHEITCTSEREGLLFCIMDIMEDWFYFS